MDNSKRFRLKKPVLVITVGSCFVIAAPFNLAHALWLSHIKEWYLPTVWLTLFLHLPWAQMAMIILLPVAGISLFFQRKTAWFFAALILCGICLQNLYYYFTSADLIYPLYVPLTINCSVLVIFYYFRFPFLDKRDKLFRGISQRFPLEMAVQVTGYESDVRLKNLSDTGCFLQFQVNQSLPSIGSTIRVCLEGDWVVGQVVRQVECGLGVQFKDPAQISKIKMKSIVAKNPSPPVTRGPKRDIA